MPGTDPPADPRSSAPELFSDALELAPEDRPAFLAERCGTNDALRSEVESLLQARAQGSEFLRAPLQFASPSSLLDDGAEGCRVGPYRILRPIAVGGMGAVYLGERVDEAFQKQVAIKLLRSGLWGADAILRFRMERQVLADLEHPGIARLIDGGSTDTKVPYLVMEFVDGVAIDRYCQDHALDLPARLRLFLDVCDAVQYAHQNLVIHRDLKPSNILVDQSGRVKLLDFGIAKVLASTAEEAGPDLTVTGYRPLTPRYASPEQALGGRMTIATDVYSLGVVLYQLLTGEFPYDLDGRTSTQIVRIISEEIPVAPGRRVAQGMRRLPTDFDTIVLKALQKDPGRRYATVEDFASDIRRHLAGLPVQARPDTAAYRVSKFVARHKVLVGSIVGVIALLATALGVSLAAYRQATAARLEAERQAYVASLVAAESALLAGQVAEAATYLDAAPAAFRGWEWRHLRGRIDRSLEGFRAHAAGITRIAFLPGGRQFVTASIDSTLKLWSSFSGDLVRAVGPLTSELESIAPFPDSTHIAVGLNNGSVLLVDLTDGSSRSLPSSGSQWAFVSASPDGRRLACGTFDGRVRVWSMPEGNVVSDWRAHDGLALPMYSPDGTLLATGGGDGVLRLYDAETLRQRSEVRAHSRRVYAMAWEPNGKRLVTGSMDQTAKVWDPESARLLLTFQQHRATVGAFAFWTARGRVASAGADNQLLVWDCRTGGVVGEMRGHVADVTALAALQDGSGVLSGDWEGLVKRWSWRTQDVRTIRLETSWIVPQAYHAFACVATGQIACATNLGVVPFYERTGALRGSQRTAEVPRRVLISPDGSTYVTGRVDGALGIAQIADSLSRRLVPAHRGPILGLALDRSATRIASSGADSCVKVWSFPGLEPLQTLTGSQGAVRDVEFAPNENLLASAGADGAVRLWDLASGRVTQTLRANEAPVDDVVFDPSGRQLAGASRDGVVRIWDVGGGELVRAIARRRRSVLSAAAWSHDGTRIAFGGSDAIVHLLDPSTGRDIVELHGHVAGLTSLQFTDDDELLSSSLDGTVRLWDRP